MWKTFANGVDQARQDGDFSRQASGDEDKDEGVSQPARFLARSATPDESSGAPESVASSGESEPEDEDFE